MRGRLRRKALLPHVPKAVRVSGPGFRMLSSPSPEAGLARSVRHRLIDRGRGTGRRKSGAANSAGHEARPCGCGDHRGIVGGERESREGDLTPRRAASAVKRSRSSRLAATPPVTRMRTGVERLGCGKGLLHQIADHGVLKAGDQVEVGCGQSSRASSFVCGGRPVGEHARTRAAASRADRAARHSAGPPS